jgi:pimeloyl-ACP methyl ester carboxylesterase
MLTLALHYVIDNASQLQIDPSKIFLFGRSLGGAVAFDLAYYAQQHELSLAGVMVENTFLSISAMVDKLMPFLIPIKPLVLRLNWDSTKLVPHLRLPILFLAGSQDELVPHEHMQHLMLMATSSTQKQLHVIDGGTHNESWMQGGSEYWNAMGDFMKRALQGGGEDRVDRVSASPKSRVDPATMADAASIPTMSTDFGAILAGIPAEDLAKNKKRE